MANGEMNETPTPVTHNVAIELAEQRERMSSFRRWQVEFETEVRSGFKQVNDGLGGLKDALADRNKTQWPVLLTALGITGGFLVYFMTQAIDPIREDMVEFKQSIALLAAETNKTIQTMAASTVSRQEMDWRAARGAEDRLRTEAAITGLQSSTVTRLEWQERNGARNQEMAALREAHLHSETALQRQVDQLRQDFGSVYGTRDIIQDLKKEIDTLRLRMNGRLPP